MPYKVAFIGAGYMAEEHLKVFSTFSEFEISGIYGRSYEKAKLLADNYDIQSIHQSISMLYESSKPDLVIIAVPELQLLNVLRETLKYPWRMLVEKPVGYNYVDALEIEMLTNDLAGEIYVALNRRHYSSTRFALEKIKNDCGNRVVHIIDQENLLEARDAGQPDEVVKNWMFANSIHMIDFFSQFCRGDIIEIQNIQTPLYNSSNFVSSIISFNSGDLGIYNGIWDAPGPWHITITTSSSRYEFRPLEKLAIQTFPSRTAQNIPQAEEDLLFKPGLLVQARQSLLMLEGLPHALPTLTDAMKTMLIIERIYGV
jgi:predicted dehydrogenase